jgi:predicted ATP-dependent serine protease
MIRYAKSTGAAIVLVGHVTKEGQIAGPRVVEHMVDACSISRAKAATTSASCAR